MNVEQLKKEYFDLVKSLGVKAEEVVLTSGSALLMYGLREQTSDLDVNIKLSLFNQIKQSGIFPIGRFGEVEYIQISEVIDLHVQDFPEDQIVQIEGVSVPSVKELLRFKKRLLAHPERNPLKMEQDRCDIERLEKMF